MSGDTNKDKLTYLIVGINTFLIVTIALSIFLSIMYRASNPQLTQTQLLLGDLEVFWPLILIWLVLGFIDSKLLQK